MKEVDVKYKNNLILILSVFILCIQWWIFYIFKIHLLSPFDAILSGFAIFAAAFLISWAAELAQIEIPQALALIFLALIAVLPEYAVDMYFAWKAAVEPSYISYAAANMTGGNRLLIGLGWASVVLVFWLKTSKREVILAKEHKLSILALLFATLYSFIIPIKGTISLIDSVVLISIFIWYVKKASGLAIVEPELVGPPKVISMLKKNLRRIITIFFFLFSGVTIYISAKPFAEGLLHAGRKFGIEEFILVQWLAPLASEAPEFIVAIIFALRANAVAGLGTLISSKINQWTLLIGMLAITYNISIFVHPQINQSISSMILDSRQIEEILLTSAQSFFALMIIINLSFSIYEAIVLAVLFITQLFFTSQEVRYVYAVIYIILGIILFVFSRLRKSNIKINS